MPAAEAGVRAWPPAALVEARLLARAGRLGADELRAVSRASWEAWQLAGLERHLARLHRRARRYAGCRTTGPLWRSRALHLARRRLELRGRVAALEATVAAFLVARG